MAKIDNEKMWASILNYEPNPEETDKLKRAFGRNGFPLGMFKNILIRGALRKQGLMEKDGEIVDYEPQFKVGDWVIYNGDTYYVENVQEHMLLIKGKCEVYCGKDDCRLWTIEDARDGDILVQTNKTFGTMIFICAGFAMNGNTKVVDYYIMYNINTDFVHKKAGDFMGNLTLDFHPATQEQRQLLFNKMHHLGYGWDDDKMQVVKRYPVSAYDMTGDALKIVEWLYVYDMKLIGLCRYEDDEIRTGEDAYIVTVHAGEDTDGDPAVVITYPNNKKLYLPQGIRRAKDLQPHIKRLNLRVIPPCSKKPEGWSVEGIKED